MRQTEMIFVFCCFVFSRLMNILSKKKTRMQSLTEHSVLLFIILMVVAL